MDMNDTVCVLHDVLNNVDKHSCSMISFVEKLSPFMVSFVGNINKTTNKIQFPSKKLNLRSWKYLGKGYGGRYCMYNPSYEFCISDGGVLTTVSKYDLPHFLADTVDFDKFIDWMVANKHNADLCDVIKVSCILNNTNETKDKISD